MPLPVIITVDDEPQVLNAIERDLRSHYGREYRIIKAGSGAEALDLTNQLKARNQAVAIFLADQRMPEMMGTEFLSKARVIYPEAKKVLLTAYADTEAAISCINSIGLDHYLMKPWDPPETALYPVLDDLLDDWKATVDLPYDGIRVAGALWSASSHECKDFLARNQIPYLWMDVEKDKEAAALVEKANSGGHDIPVVFFPDGEPLIQPTNREVAERLGLQTEAQYPFYDLIIVGGGPAGLGAAVYGASEGLRTAMLEASAPGGQAGTSSRIENYLGFPNGLSGTDLARRATAQARRLGAEILSASEVAAVRVEGQYKTVTLEDGTDLVCRALVIATGMTVRQLDIEGVPELTGAGVYYGAAVTEAAHYKDQPVMVIGGANSAGQGAMLLSQYASKVTMAIRGSTIEAGMSQYLVDQIVGTENIEVRLNSELQKATGGTTLTGVTLKNNQTDESEDLDASAMFVFIGARPHSDIVSDIVARNRAGFILTGDDLVENGKTGHGWKNDRNPFTTETNVPGIFAAGDVQANTVKRVASAVGQGAISVSFVHKYLASV